MKIQNLIRRKSGSTTTFGGQSYSFNDENDHTVEVTDRDDLARFLAIPTYQAVLEHPVEVPADPVAPAGDASAEVKAEKPARKPRNAAAKG